MDRVQMNMKMALSVDRVDVVDVPMLGLELVQVQDNKRVVFAVVPTVDGSLVRNDVAVLQAHRVHCRLSRWRPRGVIGVCGLVS